MYNNRYDMEGCGNENANVNKLYYPNFYEGYENLKDKLKNFVKNNETVSFYKWSDGEKLFYDGISEGSTSGGRRDTNIGVGGLNLTPFREGILKNDYYMVESFFDAHNWWKDRFGDVPFIAAEWSYALVTNKWFFKTFRGQIGLIGAKEKLELIQELLEYSEYRDYLGLDKFEDYITIPQKYACDDIENTDNIIREQLKNAKSKIFLEGIGHAKQALLWKMKLYHPAVYFSVGSGIDVIAGIQDNLRPYSADWVNFTLKNYDYSRVDIWRDRMLKTKVLGDK